MTTPGGGGTGNLGGINFLIKVGTAAFKKGLNGAEQTAKKTTGKIGGFFGKMQTKFQTAAQKVPFVGGALAQLATPAGLATAAIGLTVGVLAKMVTKTLDLGRSLGTARETLNTSAESIQIYRRAIEETNGTASSFDQSVLRLTRSIGDASTGNKQYQDDFERIGLSYEDMAKLSPDEALKAVTGAINEQLGPADGAAVKARLLGRGYAGMGGFANLTTQEIEDLTASVADSAVVMGGDAVDNVDEYDAAMRDVRDIMSKVAISVGTKLIPKITQLIRSFISIGEALWPVIRIMLVPLKNAFNIIFGAIDVVSKALRGDFGGAWNAVLDTALSVMGNLVEVYNSTIGKLPGVAEIDMDRVRAALEGVRAEAKEELTPALEETAEAAETLTSATDTLSEATDRQAEKIAAWHAKQEVLRTGVMDVNEAVSDGLLPTLDELEEQTDDVAEAFERASDAVVDFSSESVEALTALELSQARSYENAQRLAEKQAEAARLVAEELAESARVVAEATELAADRRIEAEQRAADEITAAHDRLVNSWERFKVNQDATIAAMNENSISFDDVIEGLAESFAISTTDMANKAIFMGITYGDTMALMEAFGRAKVDGIVGDIIRLLKTTDVAQSALTQISLSARQAHNRAVAAREGAFATAANQFSGLSTSAKRAFIQNAGGGDVIENFARVTGNALPEVPTLPGSGVHVTVELDGEVFNEAVASANTGNGRRGV